MPELPEVETVKRGLAPVLVGQRLGRVTLHRADLRFCFPPGFAAHLTGQRVLQISRRAKYLLWELESGATLLTHLGMSGRFTFAAPEAPLAKHDHVVFTTQAGLELRYNDPRRFGFMDLIAPGQRSKFLTALGPEPLGNAFHASYLADQLAGRRSAIKARLLDQRVVVGVGNIYACEALYQAGIRPTRQSALVTQAEATRLTAAIRDVLADAIAAGGSSLRDFVQTDGELGYFQHSWRVYGREGQACHSCQRPIKRLTQAGRSSFYCEGCQV